MKLFQITKISNLQYEGVFKIFQTDTVKIINLTTQRMWKLPTSTHLQATLHNDSLDMVVLPSTGASCYHNCYIDGGTSLKYFNILDTHSYSNTEVKDSLLILLRFNRFVCLSYEHIFDLQFYFDIH
jgi:hypothetical protein